MAGQRGGNRASPPRIADPKAARHSLMAVRVCIHYNLFLFWSVVMTSYDTTSHCIHYILFLLWSVVMICIDTTSNCIHYNLFFVLVYGDGMHGQNGRNKHYCRVFSSNFLLPFLIVNIIKVVVSLSSSSSFFFFPPFFYFFFFVFFFYFFFFVCVLSSF